MAKFTYTALDAQGQQTTGVVDSASDADVITMLKAQGLYPTSVVAGAKAAAVAKKNTKTKGKGGKKKVKSKAKAKTGKKVPNKPLMVHTRQLATLVHSGLPLLKSLSVLANQEPNPVMKATINVIADSVQSGTTYSEALSQHPIIFNKLYINMVKAGELGGVLEQVLARLAEYMEKAEKLKNKVISAAIYPIIVLVMAVLILTLLMVFIIPRFKEMFDGMDSELPALSKVVFGFSDFMIASAVGPIPNAFLIIGGVVLTYFLMKLWSKSAGGKKVLDNMAMKLPLIGSVTLKSSVSRFTRT